jgi:spore coat protein H
MKSDPYTDCPHVMLLLSLLFFSGTSCQTSSDAGQGDSGPPADSDTNNNRIEDDFTIVDRSEIGVVPFNQETLLEYHVVMDTAHYEEMKKFGDDEVYRPISLEVRGDGVSANYEKVGLRYKGDYSLHHCWNSPGSRRYDNECAKLSMKIKFNEYNEEARFYGLKKINLHAMSGDDTKLRERLAYSVYNEFGVETARTAHAKLYINDEEPLLVLAVEQIDGRYMAYRHPDSGDGNLYKERWPTANLIESDLLLQLRTNDQPEDNPDVSDFIAFGDAVAAADEASFLEDMAAWVDVHQLIRYMAVDRAIKNWDGITAFYWPERPHNNYWYLDNVDSSVYQLIPWDLDNTFYEYDPYMDPDQNTAERQVPNWNVLPLSCDSIWVWYHEVVVFPPGCDNFINLLAATSWDEFVTVGNTLLDTGFKYDAMNEKVTTWANQIADTVDEDPLLDRANWEANVEALRAILKKSIDDFEAHLEEGYIIEE